MMLRSRPKRVLTASIAAASLVVAGGTLAATGTIFHGGHVAVQPHLAGPRLGTPGAHIANLGTPMSASALAGADAAVLDHASRDGNGQFASVDLLGSHDGASFYRLANATAPDCYAVGPRGEASGLFGQVACPSDFPDTTPIVDFTVGQADRVMGIAADNVAEIDLVDAAGVVVARARVANNLYSLPPADHSNVTKLEAVDASGKVLYTEPQAAQHLN